MCSGKCIEIPEARRPRARIILRERDIISRVRDMLDICPM